MEKLPSTIERAAIGHRTNIELLQPKERKLRQESCPKLSPISFSSGCLRLRIQKSPLLRGSRSLNGIVGMQVLKNAWMWKKVVGVGDGSHMTGFSLMNNGWYTVWMKSNTILKQFINIGILYASWNSSEVLVCLEGPPNAHYAQRRAVWGLARCITPHCEAWRYYYSFIVS